MSSPKRPASALSNDEDVTSPKTTKAVRTTEPDFTDLFEVKINVPSVSKAVQNDYKPPTYAQIKMRSICNGGGASPLTEEEKRELYAKLVVPRTDHAVESNSEPANQQPNETTSPMMDTPLDEDDIEDDYATDRNFDEYEGFRWFETINGEINLKRPNSAAKQSLLGFCTSALLRRKIIRGSFYHDIEEPTQESSEMGFALFDRYGRLKPEFKKHASKPGSGIWGDEMDIGDIHLIDRMQINDSHRHRGIGKMLLEAVLDKGITKSNSWTCIAIARVAVLTSDIRPKCEGKTEEEQREIFNKQEHTSQCFLRSLGFRRIGWTEWFARAGNKKHPFHGLSSDQDFNPPPMSPSTRNDIMSTLIRDLKTLKKDESRLDATQKALGGCMPDDSAWTSADLNGNTLPHHLADSDSPECVKWVLSEFPQLADFRNSEGNTTLESFLAYLEISRTQGTLMAVTRGGSDKFSGYSEAAIETLVAMKGLADPAPEDLLRLKYGCTCEQCQFGFLSPRMHFVLLACAEIEHDKLSDDMFIYDGNAFLDISGGVFEYLPASVRDNFRRNRSIRQGFANLFGFFAECLKKNELPVPEAILHISRRTRE
ncbi:putative ankyrin repeat family protein [Fusarium austroafricanum]|uniref:Putative ankyrin repeat family protein n=1 Tax=Fusarium austroafricanum TaxID=2364996 RepID=A0A8H4P108_9HYPO|nr:putative ankyrin repeat family protein [Fusarium austroafricanum]